MRAAVYALECRGIWSIWISLDFTVDRWWWSGAGPERQGRGLVTVDKLVLLSPALPLGWAVKLRDSFKQRDGMRNWGAKEWGQYVSSVLEPEMKEEREAGGMGKEGWPSDGVSLWRVYELRKIFIEQDKKNNEGGNYCGGNDLEYALLESEAEQLSWAVAGRSLLQPEIEALLAEGLPELTGRWRQAAQLAHLQGRLTFAAAVGSHAPATLGAWARQLPAGASALARAAASLPHVWWRGVVARRAVSRCLRCGSAPTGRTACAACGLMGCAYCEACLALGRSRACALLLHSAALSAVRCTAALDPTAAAVRWGLSPAQAGAAGAALGFLAERRERSANSCPERFLLWAVTGAGKTEMIFP